MSVGQAPSLWYSGVADPANSYRFWCWDLGAAMTNAPKNVEVALEPVVGSGWKSFEAHVRKTQTAFEETVDRNVDLNGNHGGSSDGNADVLLGTGK